MHIFASLSNHMRKQNCHIYFILVTDLAITLLISSRVSIYRVCFEHFYHKVIQSVVHSLNTIFKVQKPVHVIYLFFISNVIFKVCEELGRDCSPLVALCFMLCGLEEMLLSRKVSQKFLYEPLQVLCFGISTFLESSLALPEYFS